MKEPRNKYIQLETVRREDQKKVMEEIEKDNVCPFCMDHFLKYHKRPIIKNGTFWVLTENQWPYEKVKHQLLAIYKTHINTISEMDPNAGKELIEMFAEETKKRKIAGGGIAMRFGSNPGGGNYGSSVLHLHAHLIEPDLEALGENEAWRFKFGQPKNYTTK
jgi:diadenosine tetraphosphate (Ap4A) HIT family hydrolase